MRIGELARAAGVSPSAIRYYEAVGIMPPPPRKNGAREYGPQAIDELKIIRFCRASGIPIKGLTSIAMRGRSSRAQRDAWVSVVESRMADLDAWMQEAARVRLGLERAIACRCEGERDECSVLQATDAMVTGAPSQRSSF